MFMVKTWQKGLKGVNAKKEQRHLLTSKQRSAHLYIGKPMCAIACKQAIKNPAHGRGSVCSICGFVATLKPSISQLAGSPTKRQSRPIVLLCCWLISQYHVLVGFFIDT